MNVHLYLNMVDQRLVNYVKLELSKNFSLNQIKQSLLAKGWSDYDVNEAVSLATQKRTFPTTQKPTINEESTKKSSKLGIILISIVVIIVIGSVFAFFMFVGKEKPTEVTKNCTLNISTGMMMNNIFSPVTRVEILKGVDFQLAVSSFQGTENDITWKIENTNIASVNLPTGSSNMIRGEASGSTQLIITDNSVGTNCKIHMPVIVTSDADECTYDTECNDNNLSTKDICSGTPRKCSHTKITNCISKDNYCPSGCTYENDNDCKKPGEVSPEVVDCGTDEGETIPTADNPTTASNCMTEKIKSCSPAKYTFISNSPGSEGKTTATIQGINGNKCLMKFEFITHPMPEFSGTEMICEPSMADREAAFAFYFIGWSIDGCTGSFVDAFKAKQKSLDNQ